MARGVTTQIERAVTRFAHTHHLWSPGATLVVGVSGGPDSLCLLGALHALTASGDTGAPGHLIVAHLDHEMRGEAGGEDASWVRAFAAELGIECVTERSDVPKLARSERRSLEEAGRNARYAFMRRILEERRAERICVGHTSDDQLETLVMNWLRGSGLAGLSGMAPLTSDIARPLLGVTHAQTLAYCAARGWRPREDASNTDTRFRRNRVRAELIPALRQYNPNLRETLVRNAALLADDDAYLAASAATAWRELAHRDADTVSFAMDSLREAPPAIRHRLFQRALSHLAGDALSLEAVHVVSLDALIARKATGGALALPGQLRALRDYDTLLIERQASQPDANTPEVVASESWRLQAPGSVDLPALGWRLRAWYVTTAPGHEQDKATPPPFASLSRHGTAAELRRAESRVYVDAEQAGEVFEVRAWRPGDRFQPLGTPFDKKVQDYFVDAKTPRRVRGRTPLVFGRGRLVWLAGQRIDDRVKLTPATQRVLVLQLEPLGLDVDSMNAESVGGAARTDCAESE